PCVIAAVLHSTAVEDWCTLCAVPSARNWPQNGHRNRQGWFFWLLCGLMIGLACPEPAAAQTAEELSEARAAFQRGIELEQAKNWAGALKQFREVGQVKMTPQVRYHIALCEENLGKLVAALGGYELALADAESVGDGVSFKQEVEASIS